MAATAAVCVVGSAAIACGGNVDVTTGGDSSGGGATTPTASGATGTGGSGGQGEAAGAEGGTGGTSVVGTGGTDSSIHCGQFGLTCDLTQICLKFTVISGTSFVHCWERHDDPCAPYPVTCDCVSDLCGSDPNSFCQESQFQLTCYGYGP